MKTYSFEICFHKFTESYLHRTKCTNYLSKYYARSRYEVQIKNSGKIKKM